MKNFESACYEAASNTLFITSDFAKKVSNPQSREYRWLNNMRHENLGMKVEVNSRKSSNRLTYKEMETRLHRVDKNGNLVKAFALVVEIAKTEKSPYAYAYNWYKKQMEAIKEEKENEKKASASSMEDMKKQLAELTSGIAYDTSADVEEAELEEEVED